MRLLLVGLAVAVAAGGEVLSLAAAAAFRIRMLIPHNVPAARAMLIVPMTGPLPDIERLFAALSAQTLCPARLVVVVESRDDPAHDRIAEVAPGYPELAIELVVAGLCDRRAQKLTNLLAGLARLGPTDDYVVFFDADIMPQPWWLASLVAPLAVGRADIVNGYRWQLPRVISAATIIGAAIDRAIAVLPRPVPFRLLWGGSIGFTRPALDAINMPATLDRALTEDLTIAARAADLGLRVLMRTALHVPAPLDPGLAQLWRFARRQYQMVNVYRPGLWRLAFAAYTADLIARMTLVAAVLGGGLAGHIAIAGLIASGLLDTAAIEIRRAIGRQLGAIDPPGFTLAHHLVAWTVLVIPLFHATAIWAGARYSPVTWRHVRYTVDRRGRVISAVRSPHRA